jgi:phage gpG-like protein
MGYQLTVMEDYFENTEAFTEMAKQEAQIDMATRFETETDPDGDRWPTLKYPAPDQIGILQLTGAMRDAAVSDEAYVATPVGLFFNTSVLPEYWVYHEQPGNIGETRNRIPQRRFIGLDAATEQKLENRAEEWMAGGIALGSRGFVRQVRSPIGRFAPAP